jgi:hypothetical protein
MAFLILFTVLVLAYLLLRRASQRATQGKPHETSPKAEKESVEKHKGQNRSQPASPAFNPTRQMQGKRPKSPRSIRENVAAATGSSTGKWREPIYRGEKDFAEMAALLGAHSGRTARSLAALARSEIDPSFDKHRVNSALYRMWHQDLVEKVLVGQVPHWFLK